mmetsp:Transcript_11712/g.36570  ORF Transcript_11712/g.36570 Transcript_11712/m.36570 type:complete len:206 (+) Transcript_11712:1092-1709(+)
MQEMWDTMCRFLPSMPGCLQGDTAAWAPSPTLRGMVRMMRVLQATGTERAVRPRHRLPWLRVSPITQTGQCGLRLQHQPPPWPPCSVSLHRSPTRPPSRRRCQREWRHRGTSQSRREREARSTSCWPQSHSWRRRTTPFPRAPRSELRSGMRSTAWASWRRRLLPTRRRRCASGGSSAQQSAAGSSWGTLRRRWRAYMGSTRNST